MEIYTTGILQPKSVTDHVPTRRGADGVLPIEQEDAGDVTLLGDLLKTVLNGWKVIIEHRDFEAGGERLTQFLRSFHFYCGELFLVGPQLVCEE